MVQNNLQLESGASMSGISGQFGPASSSFSAGTYRGARRTTFDQATFDDGKSYESKNSTSLRLGGFSLGSTKLSKLNSGLKIDLK